LYDELYNIPIRNNHQFPNAVGEIVTALFNFVATVNYDLVLEAYSRDSHVAGVPHFFTKRGNRNEEGVNILDIDEIREGNLNLEYIKLHRSIDWWLNDRGKIVMGMEPNNPYKVLIDRTIIYPIYEKHISEDPFFVLYQYFRKTLFREDIALIIGIHSEIHQ